MVVKLNAFGRAIPPLRECVISKELRGLLLRQLVGIFSQQGGGEKVGLAERIFETTATGTRDEDAACAAQQLLADAGVLHHLRGGLAGRSARIFAQIQPHLMGPSILDYGCGDGEVGRRISDLGYMVSLCDIMDYRSEAAHRLPWRLLEPNTGEGLSNVDLDSLLLLTVLHHCENPESTLILVKSLRPKRIITIESVYDVSADEVFRGAYIETCGTTDARTWLHLQKDEQFCYACFWDWFYNKVVNSGVVVPYNFSRPDVWRDRFGMIGYDEANRVYLGIDQPLVPEFHVLQVFGMVRRAPASSSVRNGADGLSMAGSADKGNTN